jgi:hypothetical protein
MIQTTHSRRPCRALPSWLASHAHAVGYYSAAPRGAPQHVQPIFGTF